MDALAAFSSHRVSRSGATGLLSTLLSPVYSTVSCLLYCLLSTLFPLRRYRSAVSHRILHCTLSAHASPPPPQSLREYFEGRDAAGSGTDAWEERCAALAATREAALLSAAAAIEARLQGIMGKLEVEFRRRRLRISLSGAEMSAGAPIRVAVRTTVEKRPSTTGGFALALLRRATPASALAMLRGHGRPANPSLLEVASTTTVATMVRATAHSPPRREPHRRTASLPSPSSRSSRLLKQLIATTTVSSLYLPSRFTRILLTVLLAPPHIFDVPSPASPSSMQSQIAGRSKSHSDPQPATHAAREFGAIESRSDLGAKLTAQEALLSSVWAKLDSHLRCVPSL